ncbi:unnamed protein product [Staurois parvus]|uniref:Uncharacterized protein n=1 Tax=Staurois parvus TaxID=386267 RepID=A0ABN9DK59_9NEOB|nr:unnamed protein product [Staurois parvus]
MTQSIQTSLAIHNFLQIEHVQSDSTRYVLSVDKRGALEEEEDQRRQDKTAFFYTLQRINSLGSTVSITSMLYCIYRLIVLLWV